MNTTTKSALHILSFIVSTLFITNAYSQKNAIGVSFIQNGQEIKITGDSQTVKLKKEEFKLLFNSFEYSDNKFYATHIDSFLDTKGPNMMHNGVTIEDISYFADGTGLACAEKKEYECLYIDKDLNQHHYIIYSEGADKRANLEGKNGDTLRLSWTIKKYSLDNKEKSSLKKLPMNDLYLVIFNDFNLNGLANPGEYSTVHIQFE